MSKTIELADTQVSSSDPIAPVPVPGPPGNQGGDPPPVVSSRPTQLLVEIEVEEYCQDELGGALSDSSGLV
jgi:hypothetical protein